MVRTEAFLEKNLFIKCVKEELFKPNNTNRQGLETTALCCIGNLLGFVFIRV